MAGRTRHPQRKKEILVNAWVRHSTVFLSENSYFFKKVVEIIKARWWRPVDAVLECFSDMEIPWCEEGVLVEREENTGRSQGSRVKSQWTCYGGRREQSTKQWPEEVTASDEGVIKKIIACWRSSSFIRRRDLGRVRRSWKYEEEESFWGGGTKVGGRICQLAANGETQSSVRPPLIIGNAPLAALVFIYTEKSNRVYARACKYTLFLFFLSLDLFLTQAHSMRNSQEISNDAAKTEEVSSRSKCGRRWQTAKHTDKILTVVNDRTMFLWSRRGLPTETRSPTLDRERRVHSHLWPGSVCGILQLKTSADCLQVSVLQTVHLWPQRTLGNGK